VNNQRRGENCIYFIKKTKRNSLRYVTNIARAGQWDVAGHKEGGGKKEIRRNRARVVPRKKQQKLSFLIGERKTHGS